MTSWVAGSQRAVTFLQEGSRFCLYVCTLGSLCTEIKNNKRRRYKAHFSCRPVVVCVPERVRLGCVSYPPSGTVLGGLCPHQRNEGSNSRALVWTIIRSFTEPPGLWSHRLKSLHTHTHTEELTHSLFDPLVIM